MFTQDSTGEGRNSPRDYGVEKEMIPGVGCVDALEVRLDMVQVSIALGLSSLT